MVCIWCFPMSRRFRKCMAKGELWPAEGLEIPDGGLRLSWWYNPSINPRILSVLEVQLFPLLSCVHNRWRCAALERYQVVALRPVSSDRQGEVRGCGRPQNSCTQQVAKQTSSDHLNLVRTQHRPHHRAGSGLLNK